MKKYELTDETMKYDGHTLHRIRALRDFGDVKKGDLGGWVQSEKNLSHGGDAWIYDNGKVWDDATIGDYARVYDNAMVYNNAMIRDFAVIKNSAVIFERACVYNYAIVYDFARIYGHANICCNAKVHHSAVIYGDAEISHSADIADEADYICIKGLGSELRVTTAYRAYRNRANGVSVKCGCFCGDLSEFKKKVKATHGHNKYAKEYLALIKVIKAHFEIS